MTTILCEKTYYKSNWCKQILQGLKNELKKRRIEYSIIFEIQTIDNSETLFVIGSDFRWISASVEQANAVGSTPIVIFNQVDHSIDGKYHSVSSDIRGSVIALVRSVEARCKNRVCLYGVNPSSVSDVSRSEIYVNAARKSRVFYNYGSLKECYEVFKTSGEKYDAVICTNDFAAISLVKHLLKENVEALKNMEILSCSPSSLSAFYSRYIRTININFTSFGKNAYEISRIAARGENISEISLTVKWDMDLGNENSYECVTALNTVEDEFYNDPELIELMMLDKLFESADSLDRQIIALILKDMTYCDIAESSHLSEQAVKYRVKQILEMCGLKKRKELCTMLKEYNITL